MDTIVLANGYKVATTITLTVNGKQKSVKAPALVKGIHSLYSAEAMANKGRFAHAKALDTLLNGTDDDGNAILGQGGIFRSRDKFLQAVEVDKSEAAQELAALRIAEKFDVDTAKTSVAKCYAVAVFVNKHEADEAEAIASVLDYTGYASIGDMLEDKKYPLSRLKEDLKKALEVVDEADAEATETTEAEAEAETEAEETEAEEVEMIEIEYNKHKYSIPADVLEQYRVK